VPDDDLLFPSDPTQRSIARELFAAAKPQPLICPHGHVDASILAEDSAFPDPANLLIVPDTT
jgi:glucuronate isomerase